MATQHPQIGAWYIDQSTDTLFEVVAIDDHSATVEIQFEGGDIDELDMELWLSSQFQVTAAPEDAASAYGMGGDDEWDEESYQFNPNDVDTGRFDLDQFQDFDDFY